ncbi:hypothetical protein NK6_773 [Bradyrhizobium diazoefficiens]|uniref:Uncharacterized protein n=1 Tax=Bradyrhizobium diazoefficiens TaxID=1355477 RepID=A0A0E4BJU5_9BRAD|nr:hypothetical protein NK6_773 [Bradyrhizobium diazoefficiens]
MDLIGSKANQCRRGLWLVSEPPQQTSSPPDA